jgi:lipopolysaccharide transport system permease protein
MLDLLNVADILGDFARRHPVEPMVIRKDPAKYERGVGLAETVYTAESTVRRPFRLIGEAARDVWGARELAWRLMLRDVSVRYRQSLLGYLWAFVPPLVMAVGFTLARQSGVITIGQTDLPYPAYVILGTLLWQTFTEALIGPVQALAASRQLMARIQLRHEALIMATAGETLLNVGIKLILVTAVFLWYGIGVTWTVALVPAALMQLVLLGTFFGVVLAPFGALYGDVPRALPILAGFWLFLTPVVYPVPPAGAFGTLVRLNPVTPVLVTTRELATTGQVSDPVAFLVVSGLSILGLALALLGYRLAMPFVVERMSA